jgi:hypothetical protein
LLVTPLDWIIPTDCFPKFGVQSFSLSTEKQR